MNKLNNLNVNYLKIPKKHRGPHKIPGGPWHVAHGLHVWDPALCGKYYKV